MNVKVIDQKSDDEYCPARMRPDIRPPSDDDNLGFQISELEMVVSGSYAWYRPRWERTALTLALQGGEYGRDGKVSTDKGIYSIDKYKNWKTIEIQNVTQYVLLQIIDIPEWGTQMHTLEILLMATHNVYDDNT